MGVGREAGFMPLPSFHTRIILWLVFGRAAFMLEVHSRAYPVCCHSQEYRIGHNSRSG